MNTKIRLFSIFSLSFLWIFTGVTSIYFSPEIGYEILAIGGTTGALAKTLIYSGGIIDIAIGVWMLSRYRLKWCLRFQIIIIISYSILLSFIAPEFWLHPFGPLTKNIPIIALTLLLLEANSIPTRNHET